ncbi:glycosyltransferase [Amycolatopsis sp. QT-25]|uniref:glycosyltransferase family 8 protein n=1 Tax=Amycolatopsis sp. QT-25 TaxID=3034022 RepID=UPI0023EDA5BB|nr:glycosyltransferase [Amycolatopsis sp. QT-25]WET76721.1 glycosyltransferase [Amycolatopsis sp. QT-25]
MVTQARQEARRDGGDHLAESVVHIATATDEAYLPYAAAMAWSLAACRDPDTELELTIMHAGVSAADQARLEAVIDGITVRWVSMHPDNYRRWGVEPEPLILDPHYFRCLLARIYPETVERAVYIDSDTVILKDLRPLWSWPLNGNPIAAVGDLVSVISDAISHWQEIGLDPDAPYFNAGVMVIDLARWRAENIGEQVMRQCQENRHRLLIQNRWNQHDQYGFNVVLQHRWTALPSGWNHYAERALDDVGIVHFLGDMKPGAPLALPECTELFIQAVDATQWAGWRPPGNTTT